jgi:hypothetical protein
MRMRPEGGIGGQRVAQPARIAGIDGEEELAAEGLDDFGWIEPGCAPFLIRCISGRIGGR